ncbi:class I mannose-6-phosphate isomerase [Echinicola salinicaeni]|uniref:class I mannose-6-phosphate isomerase n=1 Tax=Echinicola salinicaeni TaxID=2762757 RepID=UPI0016485165|nr:class I mannose-6-phosphate isomerase [Echinicola salinicaeni]
MKRATDQYLIPETKAGEHSSYDIYPSFPLIDGEIYAGYEALVEMILTHKTVILDGYVGVDWNEISVEIQKRADRKSLNILLFPVKNCYKGEKQIEELVAPFLGGADPIFGRKGNIDLIDFFDQEKLTQLKKKDLNTTTIIYGCGAQLTGIEGYLVYFDLPKNELQFRMRAGAITNLGLNRPKSNKQAYKHFYFVDWEVLNKAKKEILPQVDLFVDQQRPGLPVFASGQAIRSSLDAMSRSYFRVRPWFEPGVWGGQWIKEQIKGLNPNVPNYAWSFEMIVPENGLLFEQGGRLMEVSFDMLMYQSSKNVLGKAAKRFGDEFPIRFDFLDTYSGGNLSVQCHPKLEYIKEHFGEHFTQDETYYILDAEEDAEVYLGFQENIEAEKFRQALQESFETKEKLDVEKYVQKFPSKKHDLFLIPNGTVHCSGINNLVLEISATPYIYTFKMYDWQRLDLDGNPRPLNIDRAMENLDFSRKGEEVKRSLISQPEVLAKAADWKKVHLPTHEAHFYDVFRYEFDNEVIIHTDGQCHLLMLVEGSSIQLEIENGKTVTFQFAETFAIPAASRQYKLIHQGEKRAKVVVSFVKEEACNVEE